MNNLSNVERILEVNVDDQGYGGVFVYVMNLMNHIDRCRFILDICAFEPFEQEEHIEYIEHLSGRVYDCSSEGFFLFKQLKTCMKFYHLLRRSSYHILHVHSDVAYKLLLYSFVAKMAGVKKIIVHSHSSGVEGKLKYLKKVLQILARPVLSRCNFTKLACSRLAARWMYSTYAIKNVLIAYNGIDLERFAFNATKRYEVRKKFGLADEVVVGTVGRFSFPKNPDLMLRVFVAFYKQQPNARLLWVGEGSDRERIEQEAAEMGVLDRIIFYGTSDRVEDLYQAMDMFVMTSRFEGLGISLIEAQAAGLPCFCTSAFPTEALVNSDVYVIHDAEDISAWTNGMCALKHKERENNIPEIMTSEFAIQKSADKMVELYTSLL